MDPQIVTLLQPLGVAAPFVAYLIYKDRERSEELKQVRQERIQITERFLLSLDQRAKEDRDADAAVANAFGLYQQQATSEHRALLESLKDLTMTLKDVRDKSLKG